MKKIYFLLILASIGTCVKAQSVLPNPGFENWTQIGSRMDPDNWNTLNPNTAILGILTCTKATGSDVHSGNAAIKLTTKAILGQNANGLATTGNITVSPPGVSGGVAYTGRPDSIAGWYKYTSVNNDNGFIEFQLLGSSATPDTIGYVRVLTPAATVGTYTRFSAAINYRSLNPVAKSIWIMSSSAGFNAQVNSTIYLDDFELIGNSIGIKEVAADFLSFTPNPVQFQLQVQNTLERAQLKLVDALGNLVLEKELFKGKNTLDLASLPSGIYFYTSGNEEKNNFQKGKIVVAH